MIIPNSLTLLALISQNLDKNQTFFESGSEELQQLRTVLQNPISLSENQDFLTNPAIVLHFQTLLLAGLSMFGGISVPVIRTITKEETALRMVWDSGLTDTLTWGVWDAQTQVWCHYILDRLSGKRVYKDGIDGMATVYLIKSLIESYATILNACDERVSAILSKKRSLISYLTSTPSHDLIFIIISSLPTEQMNALFLFIQQFFPDNLDVISPSGNKLNVSTLFQTPSSKVDYLMEKTRVYLDLYFSNKYPILKEITQSKTVSFLEKSLQNTTCLESTLGTIQSLKTVQIDTRLQLYQLLSAHLVQLM